MLKSFKTFIAVASLIGFFLILPTYFANAGVPPGELDNCVRYWQDFCYNSALESCVISCTGPKRGRCVSDCYLSADCCFNFNLFQSCELGSEQLPEFC